MKDIVEIIKQSPVIPVLSFQNTDEAVQVCNALYEAGIKVLEITLRHKSALDAIVAVKASLPNDADVGAGTITSTDLAESAIAVGAAFGVSPGLTPELGRTLRALRWPFLPGISSVSEAMLAREIGFKFLKFFPAANSGGTQFLKAIASVLPDLKFCPTGGISEDTFIDYLNLPNVIAVGGSWLTSRGEDGAINLDLVKEAVKRMYAKLPRQEEG